jgi:threonine dehydrogenase-like Zn-dependent dehydrogenase
MLAAVKTRPERGIELIEVAQPVARSREVLIEVAYCGICGSDLPVYQWSDPPAKWAVNLPRVMGHEFAGYLTTEVDGLAMGSLVAVEPGTGCGNCVHCRDGYSNLCASRSILGIDRDGAFARYVSVPIESLRPVPADMDARRAAFLEVFAIAIHALERAKLRPADAVLVVGAGPIALSIAALSVRAGASRPVLVGTAADAEVRFALAGALGAEPVKADALPAEAAFDVVFEVSGATAGVASAVGHCLTGGRVVAIGTPPESAGAPWNEMVMRAIRLTPVRARLPRHWVTGAEVLRRLELPEAFFTELPLGQIGRAFRDASERKACKVLVSPA